MKTVTKIGFLAVAVLGIALVAPAAHATCGSDVTFGNFPTSGSCPGGGSCYVYSPGKSTIASLNSSVFWVIHKGNPIVNVFTGGIDNGCYKADGTCGSKPWLVGPYNSGFQLNSGWAQGITDGCADDTNDTMAVAFYDTDVNNNLAYVAFSTANLDFSRGSQWDFGTGNAHIQLVPFPWPTVTATSRDDVDPTKINVTVTWDVSGLAAGFTPNGGTATLATVLLGYEVYTIETPGTTAPAIRDAMAWTSRATVAGADATTATFQFKCTTLANNAFIALGLNLDSGFKSPFVSDASPTPIACDPNLATPRKGKLKPIERKLHSNN